MSFQEKSIQCFDCGTAFAFTVEEQEFFSFKGYTNEPKRCPTCQTDHGKNDRAVTIPREATQATSHNAKCSPLRVHAVGKLPKFRSNPEKADRYIAVIAIVL